MKLFSGSESTEENGNPMNRRVRLLAIAAAVTISAGVGFQGSVAFGALTTFDVRDDAATCNTTSGTIAFSPHLTANGPTTGAFTAKVAIALAGCLDDSNSSVKMFKGATTMFLRSNNGSNCSSLLGLVDDAGDSQIVWTPAAGQAFIPKTMVGTAQKSATNVHLSQVQGGVYSVSGEGPWDTSYGEFSLGAAYGTDPVASTFDFTNGDGALGGNQGWLNTATQEDIANILTQCSTTAGLATLHFGIGATHWGGYHVYNAQTSSTTCLSGVSCVSPTVVSADTSTDLQVTADPSANSQTLTLQVGTELLGPKPPSRGTSTTFIQAMQCTLPGSQSVVAQFHTTAHDAGKVAHYVVHNITNAPTAATFANNFYLAHTNIAGCFGAPLVFNGWSPSGKGATWADGPYAYGAATLDATTQLYEAFLDSCTDAAHPNIKPCFKNTNGSTSNNLEIDAPFSNQDPRISH